MNRLASDANHCFVCGPANARGLHLTFRLEGDICLSSFTPEKDLCGYDGVTHGGIIFSALDDVMANWLFLNGFRTYTAKCEIRYRHPLPIGTRVRLEGHCLNQKGRLAIMKGLMIRDDNEQLVAEARASFMLT